MAQEVEIRPLAYNVVAASATAQTLTKPAITVTGVTAGKGSRDDILEYLEVVPETLTPGAVTLIDGATSVVLFAGGAGSVADLKPFTIVHGSRSQNAAYQITTGANVHVVAHGRFS